jgi:hypothetical protein
MIGRVVIFEQNQFTFKDYLDCNISSFDIARIGKIKGIAIKSKFIVLYSDRDFLDYFIYYHTPRLIYPSPIEILSSRH